MLTDASNHELDRLNQHAQDHRLDAGELGAETVSLPDRSYGLRSGDEIVFTAQHRVAGEQRVENGIRGTVTVANERDSRLVIRTEEPKPRDVDVSTREFDGLRLAYAQHVYKAQGLTTDRALVLTGGWQTDRETSYVALTRAREQTDIYTSREDLGHQGLDSDAIQRLAQRAGKSNAQAASISREQAEPDREPSRFARELRDALGQDRPHARERDRASARGSFAEELRRIQQQQREHDRDRSEGLEL
jgi:ATP-dependent exoDNAse (exonuclease V) alpha subunit